MALIKCPECGKDFSEFASSCPNCGCPIEIAKKGVKTKKKSISDSLNFTFEFKGEKSYIELFPDTLEVQLVGADLKRTSFIAEGILSINKDKIYCESEHYKNSAFKKALKSGAIAAIFGMGLIIDTRGYRGDVEIVKYQTLVINCFGKEYLFNVASIPFVNDDDSFKEMINVFKDIENSLIKINRIITASFEEKVQEQVNNVLRESKHGDLYIYSDSHKNQPHYFAKNPTKAIFEELLNEVIKNSGSFGVYDSLKKNTLFYDVPGEILFFDFHSDKSFIEFSKEPISKKKATEYLLEMFNNGVINPKGFDDEDQISEEEYGGGFALYGEIGDEFKRYLDNPKNYVPTKIGVFSVKYYVRERSTQKYTFIYKNADCTFDDVLECINKMEQDAKTDKYRNINGSINDLGIDLILNNTLIKLSYCSYYPGFIYVDGNNVYQSGYKFKLTHDNLVGTFKYLFESKSLPLIKGWDRK